jgi:hypothetical protein
VSEEAARAERGVCAKCQSKRVNFHFYLLWFLEPFLECFSNLFLGFFWFLGNARAKVKLVGCSQNLEYLTNCPKHIFPHTRLGRL